MNWQQETACLFVLFFFFCFVFFYKGSLRYSLKNDIQGLPNFFKNIWLERYTFALLTYM